MISGPQGTWFNDGTPFRLAELIGATYLGEPKLYSYAMVIGKEADHVRDNVGPLRFAKPNIRAVFDPKIVRECDEIQRRFGI